MAKILFFLCSLMLIGCSTRCPSYGQDSDNYLKSVCHHCQKDPFYINGHWVQ